MAPDKVLPSLWLASAPAPAPSGATPRPSSPTSSPAMSGSVSAAASPSSDGTSTTAPPCLSEAFPHTSSPPLQPPTPSSFPCSAATVISPWWSSLQTRPRITTIPPRGQRCGWKGCRMSSSSPRPLSPLRSTQTPSSPSSSFSSTASAPRSPPPRPSPTAPGSPRSPSLASLPLTTKGMSTLRVPSGSQGSLSRGGEGSPTNSCSLSQPAPLTSSPSTSRWS
mmetsp:Transcript_9728/g.22815  ORF Transcript_9728/g.22815 Transcript_9728/m.22815 type:complete len:222 (-) Transcript_9728:815-1480(-)